MSLPHVGEHGGIFFAYGYSGTGVVRASWLGHKVAQRTAQLDVGRRWPEDGLLTQSKRLVRLPSTRSTIARAASSTFVPGPNAAPTPMRDSSSQSWRGTTLPQTTMMLPPPSL
jgi:hypothetical protein